MSNRTTPVSENDSTTKKYPSTLPFSGIRESGAFVCRWSGHLLRVPQTGVKGGSLPALEIIGPRRQLNVTRIDDDPFIPVQQARILAADLDVFVNF